VLRIHPVVDAQTRQGAVEIQLRPVPPGARPGQLCRVTLQTGESPRRTIPLTALQYDSEGAYIYRVDASDGAPAKAVRGGVDVGLQFDDRVEILGGLADGDRIVVKGFLGLKPGKPVRVIDNQG
jgi:membrane fusion protein (multidrug efflux system)